MRRRIWLASYPKSGNTWFRLLMANLHGDEGADINRLPPGPGIAGSRVSFDRVMLVASGLLTHEECDLLRPAAYRAMANMDAPDPDGPDEGLEDALFVKTHDAWTDNGAGQSILGGADAAAGAILIVRDPRDVVASFANHSGETLDAMIAFMADRAASFSGRRDGQPLQMRQTLLDWSGFQASWLDQHEIPLHLIRYEDLQADAPGELIRAMAFAGIAIDPEKARRAADFARFGAVRAQEAATGFAEAPCGRTGVTFFRRGVSGGWRDELSADQAWRVETAHAVMMARLGYERMYGERECA